jgi:hypothetical protein
MTWHGVRRGWLWLAFGFALAACDVDGVTPICSDDARTCITPPAVSDASAPASDGAADDGAADDGADGDSRASP